MRESVRRSGWLVGLPLARLAPPHQHRVGTHRLRLELERGRAEVGDQVGFIAERRLLDEVVGIGTCSGADTDKFARFRLTPVRGKVVKAPLIKECLANIECRVIDIVTKHNIVVLEGLAAYMDSARKERRTVHAVGDGTFVVDGRKFNRRKMMTSKIPEGV